MNVELIEMIDLMVDQLLMDNKFCGSVGGRRLRELRWELTGRPVSDPTPHATAPRVELVSSMVVLPMMLDAALSVTADQTGRSRNALIETAIETLIAENRPSS